MNWIILILAGLFETAWAIGLKQSQGFHKLGATIFTFLTMAISIYLLAAALKTLPVGTAYAVWTGIGAIGTAVFAMIFFQESCHPLRLISIALIIIGIIGLRLTVHL